VHAHPHHHDHAPPALGALNRAFGIAISANLAFTMIEFVVSYFANSVSLFADATHNLSDILALLLAWGASYLAMKPGNPQFSYGYGKSSIFAAMVNALILVVMAVFIGVEAFERIFNASESHAEVVVIAALCGVFVNGATAWLFLRESHRDLNVRAAFLHLAVDALLSFGVVAAGLIMIYTGMSWPDPVMGMIIAVVIVGMTWRLLVDAFQLMMDAVPREIDLREVQRVLSQVSGVEAVHDLHVWALSTRENCLTAHLVMPNETLLDEPDGYRRVGEALKSQFSISHVTLQIERTTDCATQDCEQLDHV